MKNKKIAILGWAVDTQDVEPWLRSQGADVTILDEKEKPFGDLSGYDLVVRSPGVNVNRPELKNVEVTSKTKLFFDVCPCPIIGVTGTKGKGTTSTLIYEILKAAGKDVYLGGNIGGGVFQYLDKLTIDSLVVMELSSFQLIDLHKSPHIAVVLMTTSEHLNWHANVEEYVNAKSNITKFQAAKDFAVVNKDYENSKKIGELGRGKKIWVSKKDWTKELKLRGEHNRENMAAAAAVAKILDIRTQIVEDVAKNFNGLEHRLEEVATVKGVTYFDDSFSTTPETTIAAIQSFTEPTILIAGGSDKGSDYAELGNVISQSKNLKAVIVIGDMSDKIQASIYNESVQIIKGANNMQDIVEQAASISEKGDVVVLSPACASFDMFANYKDRGDQFKAAIMSRASL